MTDLCVKKADIARSFSLAAKEYDQHAFIQKEIGKRLLDRLDLMKNPPLAILDVGAGTGFITRQLQNKFPKSRLYGLDLAQGMMNYAKSKQPWQIWNKKPFYICGDMEFLPFANNSFDLIFSNFTLQWSCALGKVFAEFKRILKPKGMLLFSTLGPQTLYELRNSWAKADNFTHVNDFLDMHDSGDLLLNTNFAHPVMDMEMITITYPRVEHLLKDLKATGARNMNLKRPPGCISKNKFLQMLNAYETFKQPDGLYPATFEVIYGHAWRETALHRQEQDGVVRIPGDKIPLLSQI